MYKLVNGSRVGQVGPVDSCGQVGDLDPSLVNSRNLSRVGQVRPVYVLMWTGQKYRPVRVKMTSLLTTHLFTLEKLNGKKSSALF